MKKAKVLMLAAAVLAAMVSTTGTSYASTGDSMAKPTGSALAEEVRAPSECLIGYMCLYANANFGGFNASWQSGFGSSSFTTITCGPSVGCNTNGDFNDEASSWINNTNTDYCVYWNVNHGSPVYRMSANWAGNFNATWNDKPSSIRVC